MLICGESLKHLESSLRLLGPSMETDTLCNLHYTIPPSLGEPTILFSVFRRWWNWIQWDMVVCPKSNRSSGLAQSLESESWLLARSAFHMPHVSLSRVSTTAGRGILYPWEGRASEGVGLEMTGSLEEPLEKNQRGSLTIQVLVVSWMATQPADTCLALENYSKWQTQDA